MKFVLTVNCDNAAFCDEGEAVDYANAIQKKSGVFLGIERHIKKFITCPIDGLRYYR